MRERSISAIGIVIVGLVPAFLGGPVFAFVFTAIALIAYRELLPLLDDRAETLSFIGATTIIIAGLFAWFEPGGKYLPLVIAVGVLVPLASIVFNQSGAPERKDRRDWAAGIGATFYLLAPTYAAIALRGTQGPVDRGWFQSLADAMPLGNNTARGLGFFLMALLITWMSDTAAYLVGKSIGRTKLIPRVSPNKTIEGAIGGLVAAGITAVICVVAFGLPTHPLTAVLFGILIGVIGMLGDLGESMIKRRAGVKDSGTLIPGHGGMLDRIDALIFVLVATWALLPLLTP